jgi:hypothetical protein
VSQYLALSREGLVSEMVCPLDQGLLFSNEDLEEKIFVYCISCQYKNYIGTGVYSKMLEDVESATKK